jgi:cytochrome P450
MNALYNDMLTGLEKRREAVGSKHSFMDRVLDQKDKLDLTRHQLYFLGGTMMEGASDTSSSIILAAIQAFIKWPEVMLKAQKEIDSVVAEDKSPAWSDYASLPYVAATVKEAMRWRPGPFTFSSEYCGNCSTAGHLLTGYSGTFGISTCC